MLKWLLPMVLAWIQRNGGVIKITYKGKRFHLLLTEVGANGEPVIDDLGGEVVID